MAEMISSGQGGGALSGTPRRFVRRRRRVAVKAVVTGVAVTLVVAWTIVFGLGVVLR
jgi:hypothetical protein